MGSAASRISRKALGMASLQQMGDPVGGNTAGRGQQGYRCPTSQVPVPQCPNEASRTGLEMVAKSKQESRSKGNIMVGRKV